jgi:hypothetical protein
MYVRARFLCTIMFDRSLQKSANSTKNTIGDTKMTCSVCLFDPFCHGDLANTELVTYIVQTVKMSDYCWSILSKSYTGRTPRVR